MFQKTHHHHRKPVEITAPSPGVGHFQYPPPAHLLLQQHEPTDHNNQSKRASGRRYTTPSNQENPYRGRSQSLSSNVQPASKEDKKKKFSIFKKKKKSDNDRHASRTPEVPGRRSKNEQFRGYGPESMPLARRPHSSSSNHRGGGGGGGGTEEFIRKGSQRSIKSSDDFLDDDDEIDSSINNGGGGGKIIPRPMLQTDYPRFMSTLANGREKGDNSRLDNGRPGYDSLEKYADIGRVRGEGPSSEPFKNRSMSLRLPDHKAEHRIVPSRPAPPPPPSGNKSNKGEQLPTPVETVGLTSSGLNPLPLPPIPGLIGIKNHGNTCFMNAILQCLGNTERFLHYIISDDCQRDLATLKRKKKRRGPASPHNTLTTGASSQQEEYLSPDSPGAVIDVLSYLIKSLWGGQYEGRISAIFKEVVGLWAEQYRGRSQHDAQEFLLWLLGYLHDNLNLASRHQISKTPPPVHIDTDRDSSQTDSFVYSLFGGNYQSSLHCPECGNQSNTFDPYLSISLSVPRRGTRPIYITMTRRHQNTTKLMLFGLSVKVTCLVQEVQKQLALEARSLPHYLVIGTMREDGFNQFYHSTDPVAIIPDDVMLYAYEVTPYKGDFMFPPVPVPPVMEQQKSSETIYIILQNRVGQGEYSKKFGTPLCLRVWRDFTYSQLQSVVFKGIKKYLHEGVNPEIICRDYIFFKCRVLDGLQGQEYLDPYCTTPLQSPTVEKALSLSKVWGYELHIKIIAEWEQWIKDCVCTDIPETQPLLHDSVHLVKEHYDVPLEATLDECLQWHTQEEKLGDEDSWSCPQCKRPQIGAKKRITFSTLPDILIVHLKRFEQDEYTQAKLDTWIKFPTSGLDMSPYVSQTPILRPSSALAYQNHSTKVAVALNGGRNISTLPANGKSTHFEDKSRKFFIFKKNKKPKKSLTPVISSPVHATHDTKVVTNNLNSASIHPPSYMYDLYSVCYHYGDMNRGHYTAHCLNPVNNQWYIFDDHRVLPVQSEDQLVSQNAYILFYVRRNTRKAWLKSIPQEKKNGHWINQLSSQNQLHLSSLPPLDHSLFSPQRQGSVTSAHTLSTASGVSPDNIFFPSHMHNLSAELAPPAINFHARQYSAGSSSNGGQPPSLLSPYSTIAPPHSNQAPPHSYLAPPYPHSLPSPSIASSTPSYLSQTTPTSSSSYFSKRVGSFHGNSHHRAAHESHSATRV
ncbi:PREDICTED: ubiquitin carboxyl-terminal hydrolase 31-like [Amphimedon queenslandica]|uniref:ubiquitinyl hydrolase 1 n=1 Tax=Amphimedon queenslandica TaxID=400682 RepID=A0A1X7UU37_AMPQE|nr:PREDICTED: ubiquitin carboxyl-terminal hydrolase 31-like [Amphimedon queenslandica]|eukprot:XP_019852485.1 PREDICTED: ubiquitin carboxyl-terminal hydrolase 31-like [Amphimedon queenslandica]